MSKKIGTNESENNAKQTKSPWKWISALLDALCENSFVEQEKNIDKNNDKHNSLCKQNKAFYIFIRNFKKWKLEKKLKKRTFTVVSFNDLKNSMNLI